MKTERLTGPFWAAIVNNKCRPPKVCRRAVPGARRIRLSGEASEVWAVVYKTADCTPEAALRGQWRVAEVLTGRILAESIASDRMGRPTPKRNTRRFAVDLAQARMDEIGIEGFRRQLAKQRCVMSLEPMPETLEQERARIDDSWRKEASEAAPNGAGV